MKKTLKSDVVVKSPDTMYDELNDVLQSLPGSGNDIRHPIWRFEGTENTDVSFEFIIGLERKNKEWASKFPVNPCLIAKAMFLHRVEGKQAISIFRKTINGIIKTFAYLELNDVIALSKKDLNSYYEYVLMHDVTQEKLSKRLEPLGYKYISDGVTPREWFQISRKIGVGGVIISTVISSRVVEDTLKNVIKRVTDNELTYRDWKEGGSFNKLTLDYGRYYIEHCSNFFNKHVNLAIALKKTINCTSQIFKDSGLSCSEKTIKSALAPIVTAFLQGKSPSELPKHYKESYSIKNLECVRQNTIISFDAHMRDVCARSEMLSDSTLGMISEQITFVSDSYKELQPMVRRLVEVWLKNVNPIAETYTDDEVLVIADIANMAGITTERVALSITLSKCWRLIYDGIEFELPTIEFFEKIGVRINNSKGSSHLYDFLNMVEWSGIIYFVALTGWRESEYGFSLSDINVYLNKDILDQKYTPLRYVVNWVVPKTNGKIKLDREIIYSAYSCAVRLSLLVSDSDSSPCLYSTSTSSIKYPNRSSGYIERAVGSMWEHYVHNYEPFSLLKCDATNGNDTDDIDVMLRQAYVRAHDELVRVKFQLNKDSRRDFIWMYITDSISADYKALMERYLCSETLAAINAVEHKQDITPSFSGTVVNEIVNGALYPTPHSFRHMWAEAVYRRFDGDVGWLIRSTFKHVSQIMWLDYIRNKDNRRQHDRVKRRVISSLLYNYALRKGADYSGAMSELLRRALKNTMVKDVDDLRQVIEEFSENEIIDIAGKPWGFCFLRRRAIGKAKCNDNGIPERGNALTALCLGCSNNLTNKGNVEGILLAIANDMNILRTPSVPQSFSRESYSTVKQAHKQLKDLGADAATISDVQDALIAYEVRM
jgi:hypothetical protein